MNVAIRESSPEAEALMQAVLRDGRPIAPEYPLVFEECFDGRVVSMEEEDGQAVSTCAILTRELVAPHARFKVGLIGSVATDPDHRGRGYASEVLASSEVHFAHEGCLCSMLWADDAGYYGHRGYIPVGTEYDYFVSGENQMLLPQPIGVRPATADDAPALHSLYLGHSERVERSESEMRALLAGPEIFTLVVEREGQPAAYACRGRGADLANVVHEWAGEDEDVLRIVRAFLEQEIQDGSNGLFLMVPPTAKVIRRYLEIVGVPGARGVLGMAKLVDSQTAAELLRSFVGERGSVEPLEDGQGGLQVSGPNGSLELGGQEVLLTLLAPKGERGVVEVVEQQTGLELPDLPLTPFVWGLDSI